MELVHGRGRNEPPHRQFPNWGPILVPLNIGCCNSIYTQKGPITLGTIHVIAHKGRKKILQLQGLCPKLWALKNGLYYGTSYLRVPDRDPGLGNYPRGGDLDFNYKGSDCFPRMFITRGAIYRVYTGYIRG